MEKKISGIDERLLTMSVDEDASKMPTRREVLRMIGNIKSETADDSRRTRRIIAKLRDKSLTTLTLEGDDLHYLEKLFDKNAMSLPAWMQGQVLDLIDNAEKVALEIKS